MTRSFIFLCVSLCCIAGAPLTAQTGEYVRGGYVSLSGDTTHGYIQDRLKVSQSNAFMFKADLAQTSPQQFSPEQVHSFFYDPNFSYRSLPITIEGKTELKFLRQLVTGYAGLYEYNTVSDPVYVLTKASGEVVQLEKRDRIEDGQLKSDKGYEGLIRYTLRDCESLILRGGRIEFTQGALTSYVRRYNQCAHPETATQSLTIPRRLLVNFGVLAGKDFIKSIANNYNAAQPVSKGNGDGIQAGLLVHLSYFENLAFRTGVIYHRFEFTQQTPYSLGTLIHISQFEQLDIPLNLRYQFGKGKVSPYFFGGTKIPVYLKKDLITQRVKLIGEVENTTVDMEIYKSFRFNGGIGTRLKFIPGTNVDLSLEYEQINGELNDARHFETNAILVSLAVLF